MSNIDRKLATIRKISEIHPIEDADAIEIAVVDSWKVVVKKGEFNVGDLVCYLEIDSWVPTEIAPFLSKGKEPREYNGVKGERLRTVKLRGQISQGLILPLFGIIGIVSKFATFETVANRPYPVWIETVTEHGYYIVPERYCQEIFDIDLSEVLNIQKYEAPIPACLAGTVKGNFPSFFPKTDEERIQNLTKKFESFKEYTWEISEKLDGSSCSFYYNNGDFGVCSRNIDLKEDYTNTFWRMAAQYNVEFNLEKLGENIVIQGEIVGEGIQGNPYKLQGQHFYVFNIYDIDEGEYYSPEERRELCSELSLKNVPILFVNFNIKPEYTIDKILEIAENKSFINDKVEREGIVFKCEQNPDISFKAISNTFLLKEK
jgi:hypothetical protein